MGQSNTLNLANAKGAHCAPLAGFKGLLLSEGDGRAGRWRRGRGEGKGRKKVEGRRRGEGTSLSNASAVTGFVPLPPPTGGMLQVIVPHSLDVWRGFRRHSAGCDAVDVNAMSNQHRLVAVATTPGGATYRPVSAIQPLKPSITGQVGPPPQRRVRRQRYRCLLLPARHLQ